jgi:hypothetical protein
VVVIIINGSITTTHQLPASGGSVAYPPLHTLRMADDRCNEEIKLRQSCRERETNIMHVVRRGQRNRKRR